MNFLAHLYLTKEHPEFVSVGNFMADAVKGKKAMLGYPEEIQQGIRIHRAIDDFADTHPLFRQGTARLHERYSKFAPVIMDIFYDHILAENWLHYSDATLQDFSQKQYKLLTKNKSYLPERTLRWLKYMKMENLLYNYANESKIEQVLRRMDKRTNGISGMGTAVTELRMYKEEYRVEFMEFFEEMRKLDLKSL